jgi:hypothetical protein
MEPIIFSFSRDNMWPWPYMLDIIYIVFKEDIEDTFDSLVY